MSDANHTPAPFKDYFSGHAAAYAAHRPSYPPELFSFLASLCRTRQRAWDCATGNGQAARGLAPQFEQVIATDASEQQISAAELCEGVEFRVARAEASGFPDAYIDLVTVAQALHWFDIDKFFEEVRRVVRPGGACAAWCYNLCSVAPQIDSVVRRFYSHVVGPFWPPEREIVEDRYRSLSFPFIARETPYFFMHRDLTLPELISYFGTWSATRRYITETGHDPLTGLYEDLLPRWGDAALPRPVRWEIALRVSVSD
jgi:ubiquinone/menaquinone biosynthesis C-methylase UbiE